MTEYKVLPYPDCSDCFHEANPGCHRCGLDPVPGLCDKHILEWLKLFIRFETSEDKYKDTDWYKMDVAILNSVKEEIEHRKKNKVSTLMKDSTL